MDFVDNALDLGSGTIRGRAVVNNPDGFLTPGMFGQMRLLASGSYNGMLVPDVAVVTDQTRKIALVVGADGMVSPRVFGTWSANRWPARRARVADTGGSRHNRRRAARPAGHQGEPQTRQDRATSAGRRPGAAADYRGTVDIGHRCHPRGALTDAVFALLH